MQDSRFIPITNGETRGASFLLTDDSKPLWFMCRQAAGTPASHCAAGMVLGVNAPTSGTESFDSFVAKAKAAGSSGPVS